jgi:hypothetical protein
VTFQSTSGKTHITTQRTLITQDETGHWRAEVYRPTKGLKQDTSSPLDHVVTGFTSLQPQSHAPAQSSGQILIDDRDLGTKMFWGLPAMGRLSVYRSVGGQSQVTHTEETWFSPTLLRIVHSESRNFNGTTIVTDFSDLQLGVSVSQQTQQ